MGDMGDLGKIPQAFFQRQKMTFLITLMAVKDFLISIDIKVTWTRITERALVEAVFTIFEFRGPSFFDDITFYGVRHCASGGCYRWNREESRDPDSISTRFCQGKSKLPSLLGSPF